jgi:hypothetical protein
MAPITIKRASWHFKFIWHFHKVPTMHEGANTCSYLSAFGTALLKAAGTLLLILVLITMFIGLPLFSAVSFALHGAFPEGALREFQKIGVAMWVAYALIFLCWYGHWVGGKIKAVTNRPRPEPEPGSMTALVKLKTEKICVPIVYE